MKNNLHLCILKNKGIMSKSTKSKAAQKQTITRKKPAIVEEPVGRYINPLTDFGFKLIFGNKEFLLDFLNAILKIEGGIVDLQYDNTERPGLSEDDRTTRFDLYCTLKNGERIIIEMQHHRHSNFVERTLYYASRLIQEQGEDKKGDDKWQFDLKAVFSVNIVNFELDRKRKNTGKYVSNGNIKDDDNEIICDKLNFVFLELPYFNKEVHELTGYIDWWMYALKHMAKLDHLPDALRNRIFERLFKKAEIAKLSKEDRKIYDQSLKELSDMNLIIRDRDIIIRDRDNKIAVLSKDNAVLSKDNAAKDKRIAAKDKRIAELERQLGLSGTAQRQRRRQPQPA